MAGNLLLPKGESLLRMGPTQWKADKRDGERLVLMIIFQVSKSRQP